MKISLLKLVDKIKELARKRISRSAVAVATPAAASASRKRKERELDEEATYDYTTDPHVLLVSNAAKIASLVHKTVKYVTELKVGGRVDRALMLKLGDEVKRLSGHVDFCFYEALPDEGEDAIVVQGLCKLYEKSLADGDATLSGAFTRSFEAALGTRLVYCNISIKCRRHGKDGVEAVGRQAGCTDPHGETLRVLAGVKELHMLGLLAAGVKVIGVIASANASIASFGIDTDEVEHFVPYEVKGVYAGIDIYCTAHIKYISKACVYNTAITLRHGASFGDRRSTPSHVLNGWAFMGAALTGNEGDEEAAEVIYEAVRKNKSSRVTVYPWESRFYVSTSAENEAALKEKALRRCFCGGKDDWRVVEATAALAEAEAGGKEDEIKAAETALIKAKAACAKTSKAKSEAGALVAGEGGAASARGR